MAGPPLLEHEGDLHHSEPVLDEQVAHLDLEAVAVGGDCGEVELLESGNPEALKAARQVSQVGAEDGARVQIPAPAYEVPHQVPVRDVAARDCALAASYLDVQIAEIDSLQFQRGNPSLALGEAVFGIVSLITRPFAPAAQRAAALAARLDALPAKVIPKGGLLDEARRHYEAGNYNLAIIYLYSYELIKLDQNQMIRLAKGKTNREYLRELASRPEVYSILAQTLVPFEDVFFGEHELTRERFEACWNQV